MADGVVTNVQFNQATTSLDFTGSSPGFNGSVSLGSLFQIVTQAPTSVNDTSMFAGTPPMYAIMNEPAPSNLTHTWANGAWQTITSSNP